MSRAPVLMDQTATAIYAGDRPNVTCRSRDTKQPAPWSGLFVEMAPWPVQAALKACRRREVRTIEPTAPKPMIIIAQVAGSGTALLIEAIVCTPLYC